MDVREFYGSYIILLFRYYTYIHNIYLNSKCKTPRSVV